MIKTRLIFSLLFLVLSVNSVYAEDEEVAPVEDKDEYYMSLNPHFTTNLTGSKGNHLLQLKAQLLVIGQDTKDLVKIHMPAIRHNLLMYFISLDANELKTYEEKKALSEKAQSIAQETLIKYDENARVDAFLIQSMIVQ